MSMIEIKLYSKFVPVVYCKDCKFWQDNNGYPHPDCRWVRIETPDADDYCSCGERINQEE